MIVLGRSTAHYYWNLSPLKSSPELLADVVPAVAVLECEEELIVRDGVVADCLWASLVPTATVEVHVVTKKFLRECYG